MKESIKDLESLNTRHYKKSANITTDHIEENLKVLFLVIQNLVYPDSSTKT